MAYEENFGDGRVEFSLLSGEQGRRRCNYIERHEAAGDLGGAAVYVVDVFAALWFSAISGVLMMSSIMPVWLLATRGA